MTDEQKLIPLLQRAATRWLALGHQDIWDSDDYTDDLGAFCNHIADSIASGTLSDADRKKVWIIFAPTCEWDYSVGDPALGNQIFEIVDKLFGEEVLTDK